jgi:ribosomal protein S27E
MLYIYLYMYVCMCLVYTVFDLHRKGSTLDYPKGGMGEISQSISNVITSSGVSWCCIYIYICMYVCMCLVYTVFDLHRKGSTLDYPKGGMGEISQSISNVIISSRVSLMYMFVYIYVYIYIHVYVCVCMSVYVFVYMYIFINVYIYIFIYVYIYMYIYTYGGNLTVC